jgi:hypothetical protein
MLGPPHAATPCILPAEQSTFYSSCIALSPWPCCSILSSSGKLDCAVIVDVGRIFKLIITLLLEPCGGSNADIDQQVDGKRVNENLGPRSAYPTESNPTRHSDSSSSRGYKNPQILLCLQFLAGCPCSKWCAGRWRCSWRSCETCAVYAVCLPRVDMRTPQVDVVVKPMSFAAAAR